MSVVVCVRNIDTKLLMSMVQEPLQRRPYTSVLSLEDDSKLWYVDKFLCFDD